MSKRDFRYSGEFLCFLRNKNESLANKQKLGSKPKGLRGALRGAFEASPEWARCEYPAEGVAVDHK